MSISLKESVTSSRKLPVNETILQNRIGMLADSDRILMEAVVVRDQSAQVVARLTGRTGPAVRRRIRRLSARIASRWFVEVMRSLPYLKPEDAGLARMCYLEGVAQRDLCLRLGLTPHQLRRRLDLVRGQVSTMRRQRHNSRGSPGLHEEADEHAAVNGEALRPTGT